YFVAIALPVAGLIAGELWRVPLGWRRRAIFVCLCMVPAVGTGLLQVRLQGKSVYRFEPPPVTLPLVQHVLVWTQRAFHDFYVGLTHQSFWGKFGWLDTPLVLHDE